MTLYALLTKYDPTATPFQFPDMRSINPSISEKTSGVILRALQLKPEQRYQSADEMKIALEATMQSSSPSFSIRSMLRSDEMKIALEATMHSESELPCRLRVFLCHSSKDKAIVRNLYHRLKTDGADPWLDEQKLLPGQDWNLEITKAVRASDVVIVCLSRESINKAGYVQKEIKYALDVADEQPEGTIFIIPLRLEECEVPARLNRWQWLDFFEEDGYEKLMRALHHRASTLGKT